MERIVRDGISRRVMLAALHREKDHTYIQAGIGIQLYALLHSLLQDLRPRSTYNLDT